jgi:Na+/proline symporter
VWFLPIYLGPTLAMVLAWMVLRKMIRIARTYRITSIADFVASRYGKSPLLAGLVTLITVVGIVPYIALQLKAIASGYAVLTTPRAHAAAIAGPGGATARCTMSRWRWPASPWCSAPGTWTPPSGTRAWWPPSPSSRWSSCWPSWRWAVRHLGPVRRPGRPVRARHGGARAAQLLRVGAGPPFAYEQWFALTVLSMLSVIFLPRQFQVMVVENVDERHLKRAAWVFPLYLLLINLFVLPIALGGLLYFGPGNVNADTFVLSLPLATGQHALALAAFIGGLSAATGMVIVEAIAVSTMVCNDLVMPLLLRTRRFGARAAAT